MKLSINRHHLIDALKLALPATNARSTLPVLAFVKLAANDGLLTISATNLEVGIAANVPALVNEPGEICTPAKMLADLLGTTSEETIHLESTPTQLLVKWEKSKTKLSVIDAEEFPPMPAFKHEGHELRAHHIKDLVKCVVFAASTEEARATLMGIQFTKNAAATTDGFRLSVKSIETGLSALIPASSLALVARMSKDINDCIHVRLEDESRAIFTGENWQFITQLIEGMFPDYNVIVPKTFRTKITVDNGSLRAALLQMQTVYNGYVRIEARDATIALSTSNEEGAESNAEVFATTEGPVLEFALENKFLLQAIGALSSTVTISLNSEKTPILITGDDPDFKHVIMPIQLK